MKAVFSLFCWVSSIIITFSVASDDKPWDEYAYLNLKNKNISLCGSEAEEQQKHCPSRYNNETCRCRPNPNNEGYNAADDPAGCFQTYFNKPVKFSSYHKQVMDQHHRWSQGVECGLQLTPIIIEQPHNKTLVRQPRAIFGLKCIDLTMIHRRGWRCLGQNETNLSVKVQLFTKEGPHYIGEETVHVKMPTFCKMVEDKQKAPPKPVPCELKICPFCPDIVNDLLDYLSG